MTRRGDAIVQEILAGAEIESLGNELLHEVNDGYPVSHLAELLTSANEQAVSAGIWVASELGAGASELLPFIGKLVSSDSQYVRFCVLQVVTANARAADGSLIRSSITLINDPSPAVRYQAMEFLVLAPVDVVLPRAMELEDGPVRRGVLRLLRLSESDCGGLAPLLTDSQPLERRLAAVAICRYCSSSQQLLARVAESADEDIRALGETNLTLASRDVHGA